MFNCDQFYNGLSVSFQFYILPLPLNSSSLLYATSRYTIHCSLLFKANPYIQMDDQIHLVPRYVIGGYEKQHTAKTLAAAMREYKEGSMIYFIYLYILFLCRKCHNSGRLAKESFLLYATNRRRRNEIPIQNRI